MEEIAARLRFKSSWRAGRRAPHRTPGRAGGCRLELQNALTAGEIEKFGECAASSNREAIDCATRGASCQKGDPSKDYFLRWRIFARMRRFLRPCFRRPFPDLFVPKAISVCQIYEPTKLATILNCSVA